ncbi:MAG: glycosyltransferase family 4 protein [Burkholderiaceae bacterium]|nr:glycosyltransferase family 4 protein [Burkholderiaceae bacterium]
MVVAPVRLEPQLSSASAAGSSATHVRVPRAAQAGRDAVGNVTMSGVDRPSVNVRGLFIGPLPEPITGQSLACRVFLDALRAHADVDVVDLSKPTFRQGVDSTSRVAEVLRIVRDVRRKQRGADFIYFTIAESLAGNAKDLLIYVACFPRLDRMIVHLHGGAGMRELMRGRLGLLRRMNAFFLRRMGAIVVLGERHLDVFSGAAPDSRLRIVPNFAQDELFVEPAAIDAKFASLQPLRMLFLSNLLPGKGHAELVQAFAGLDSQRRETLRIDFAGGFESESAKREFLDSIGAHPQLQYHGTVHGERKRALFAAAHVFCLPTYYPYEGQPISILEAYASGCAVITTDHSGIFDTFADGRNGIAVAKRSPASLQAALERILDRPQDLRTIALHNRRTASEQYTTARYNDLLLRIVLGVAAPVAQPAAASTGVCQ